jgi:hypothetical protein
MEEKILVFTEIAVGIVVGFMVWSYLAPLITSTSQTPGA